ncbi:transmembrane protein [Cystoisospora suis]|uniref:Transmembrane protein n=1 Tax=Cystoisospora suis TaxID=483139 RepID=A0A2C6KK60_9APIC|nr:transmembrane protein [Cystoisospora suis]
MPGLLSKLPYVSAACGGTSLLVYFFPATLLSPAPSLTETSPVLLRFLSTLVNTSFSGLFGSASWVYFVMSPILRNTLSRWKLAEVQSIHFPIFFCASTVLSSALLSTVCYMGVGYSKLHMAAAINVLGNMVNSCYLVPRQISLLKRRCELEEQLGIEKTDTAERAAEVARCATRGGDGDQAAAGLEYQDVVKAFKVHHSLGAAVGFVSFGALLPFLVS